MIKRPTGKPKRYSGSIAISQVPQEVARTPGANFPTRKFTRSCETTDTIIITAMPIPILEMRFLTAFRLPVQVSIVGFAGRTLISSITRGVIAKNITAIVRFNSMQTGSTSIRWSFIKPITIMTISGIRPKYMKVI